MSSPWAALEADTKLVVSFFIGGRDGNCARWFMDDVADRLANRVQLIKSDGLSHGVLARSLRKQMIASA